MCYGKTQSTSSILCQAVPCDVLKIWMHHAVQPSRQEHIHLLQERRYWTLTAGLSYVDCTAGSMLQLSGHAPC